MSNITRFFWLLAFAGAVQSSHAQIKSEWKSFKSDPSFANEVLPAPAQGTFVSFRKPGGMILSEGNLYFTSHDAAGATVWRTSQTSIPGQETVLYWEQGAIFGDIVFAKVDGVFFGYFFAQTPPPNFSITIRRIPLTGGTATVLANVGNNIDIVNSHRNLVTDGVNLYWQDDRAIRKMPIRGGAIVKLDPVRPNTPTAGIELQNGSLIVYASVENIRFVPTSGSNTTPESRTIADATGRVDALHAVSNGTYWGNEDAADTGSLHLRVAGVTTTLPGPGGIVSSISTKGPAAGGSQAWTVCTSDSCRLRLVFPGLNSSIAIGKDALGVTVTPSGKVFWGDAAGVHRLF